MKKFGFLPKKQNHPAEGFTLDEFIPPLPPYRMRLAELRKRAGLNQTEAGWIVSTSQNQYSRWETGNFEIPVFELTMFAIYYNRKTDYILGLSDDDTPLYTPEEQKKKVESLKISRYFNRFGMWDAFGVESGKLDQ